MCFWDCEGTVYGLVSESDSDSTYDPRDGEDVFFVSYHDVRTSSYLWQQVKRVWAAFVSHKKENEAPVKAAKKKLKAKRRQNKKADGLVILDKELVKPQGKKGNGDDEVRKGKKKKGR
ncbi:hypothetical protein N9L68_01375 [bacterium]|nr:hypothetical protein [bacterium]